MNPKHINNDDSMLRKNTNTISYAFTLYSIVLVIALVDEVDRSNKQ